MRYATIAISILAYVSVTASADNIPVPLQDLKIATSMSVSAAGLFTYKYMISNPGTNKESIYKFDIFLGQDSILDSQPPSNTLAQCLHFDKKTSANAQQSKPITPVGSTSPAGWGCSYGRLEGFTDGSFGWGADDNPYFIGPGASLGGFSLTSYGLPTIRGVVLSPWIDVDLLPKEYFENVPLTIALETKVRWAGKVIGPKMPPKVFVALDFINYLISLKEQSVSLGWIKEKGVANSLDVKLNNIKKKIGSGDTKTAKNVLNAFQKEIQAQNGKQVSPEAYALLYFNAKYLIDHL